jgi:hypothetical protein
VVGVRRHPWELAEPGAIRAHHLVGLLGEDLGCLAQRLLVVLGEPHDLPEAVEVLERQRGPSGPVVAEVVAGDLRGVLRNYS